MLVLVMKLLLFLTQTQVHSGSKSSPLVTDSLFPPPNQSLLDIGASTDIEQFVNDHQMKLANIDLVRRNSLSMRTPPSNSIAAEIMHPSVTPHFSRAQSLISEVKEMAARLSEFESCHGSTSEDDSLQRKLMMRVSKP